MSEILILGFLIGMRHALEADHIAAVASLATRTHSIRQAVFQGTIWGLGHTITLFLVCSAVLLLETAVPGDLAQGLEMAVGVMLILLGTDVVLRMLRKRVHFHIHQHFDGTVHFHAHSHTGDSEPAHHEHEHSRHFPTRALCVGLMHGLAGSAALIIITLGTVASTVTGLIYVALFGIGSIGGMAILSLAISVPLRGARHFTWLHNGTQATVGLATMAIGTTLVYENFALIPV